MAGPDGASILGQGETALPGEAFTHSSNASAGDRAGGSANGRLIRFARPPEHPATFPKAGSVGGNGR
jgi:hypothetical protein